MNKLLLFLGLIAVDCGWDNHSMLIAETQSERKLASLQRHRRRPRTRETASAEDESERDVCVVQNGEEFWIVTAANENQRTKMHSAELMIPQEFRFSPDEKWLYVELHHGSCMSGADLSRRSDGTAGLTKPGRFSPSSHHWRTAPGLKRSNNGCSPKISPTKDSAPTFASAGGATIQAGSAHHSWRRRATRNRWAISIL